MITAVLALSLALPPPSACKAAGLIDQLGATKFADREAAGKALEAMGNRAVPALEKARAAGDAEVRRRASRLVETLTPRFPDEKKFYGKWVTVSTTLNGQDFSGGRRSEMEFSPTAHRTRLFRDGVLEWEAARSYHVVDNRILEIGSGSAPPSWWLYKFEGKNLLMTATWPGKARQDFGQEQIILTLQRVKP